jgi:ATP-dependent exoDNAse (exonuclease V) beta subunit
MDTILELAKFNNIKYYDKSHKYYIGDKELVSATTFIGKFKPKFDTDGMAESYAAKRGLKVEDVKNDWDFKRDFSTVKGSALHNYAENWWNNKVFPYDESTSIKMWGIDPVKEPLGKCIKLFHKFHADASENLIPVKMELVVGDEELGIAGMVDCLFWNKKTQELQIWDYKTNKEIKTSNSFSQYFDKPISHLDVCELNTYSLQLSLYKYIIEKNTGLKIGGTYLIWINEVNDNYKVIKCKDLTAEIVTMLEFSKN